MNHPDFRQALKELRERLLALRPDPQAKPTYEWLSDAILWPDEIEGIRGERMWPLRTIWHYRTGLIIGEDRTQYAAHWQIAQQVLASWIGFLPERCRPDAGLAAIYHAGARQLDRSLRLLDRFDRLKSKQNVSRACDRGESTDKHPS